MNTFRINSNPTSALAYRNLSKTQSGLQTTLERLSSGMRINKAADDSAGSAISSRMSNQIRGMKQANRNAQDTNNLLATAELGLSDISNILGKMRELSVQASTDTLNDANRSSINLEFQALKDEFTRIANVTEYNGMNVLDGTYQTAGSTSSQWLPPKTPITQVSVHSSGTQADGDSFGPSINGDGRYVVFRSVASNLVDNDTNGRGDIFVHDQQIGLTERINVHSSGTQADGNSEQPDISADGRYVVFRSVASNLVDDDINEEWDIFVHDRQTGLTERVSIDSFGNQANGWNGTAAISSDGRYVTFVSDADNLVNNDSNGQRDAFIHDRETGATERVSVHSSSAQANGISQNPSISLDGRYMAFESRASNLVDSDTNGKRDVFEANNPLYEVRGHWRVQIGVDNDINSQHEFSLINATANGLDLEDDNVLSVNEARTAITAIDHAIDEVNQERSYIGSEQNKLQFTMSNLSSNIQNIEASRSSIEDADFVAEAADLAKNQILAQSATAMLAQASAISQNILSLLR